MNRLRPARRRGEKPEKQKEAHLQKSVESIENHSSQCGSRHTETTMIIFFVGPPTYYFTSYSQPQPAIPIMYISGSILYVCTCPRYPYPYHTQRLPTLLSRIYACKCAPPPGSLQVYRVVQSRAQLDLHRAPMIMPMQVRDIGMARRGKGARSSVSRTETFQSLL